VSIIAEAMTGFQSFPLFLAAALLVAITPGPGILYIVARTLAGGRTEGLASSVGLGLGGLVHVFAGAVGLSALVMASAEAFTLLKLAGGFYLVWLGLKTWREARIVAPAEIETTGARRALREGILVEALNPKTAAFFLAFIPQFVDPSADVAAQFVVLGLVSVALNTSVDLIVTIWAAKARAGLSRRPSLIMRSRQLSGAVMCGLGATLLLVRRTG
jgi:threonine/homoserine/homoserine lactone efflux protein